MRKRYLFDGATVVATVWSLVTSACQAPRQEASSAIVQYAEAHGSGDLSGVDASDMQAWLRQHDAETLQLSLMCTPVRRASSAGWNHSTEGRLCAAAGAAAFTRAGSQPVIGDNRRFGPTQ